jgi:hypothetical protein
VCLDSRKALRAASPVLSSRKRAACEQMDGRLWRDARRSSAASVSAAPTTGRLGAQIGRGISQPQGRNERAPAGKRGLQNAVTVALVGLGRWPNSALRTGRRFAPSANVAPSLQLWRACLRQGTTGAVIQEIC